MMSTATDQDKQVTLFLQQIDAVTKSADFLKTIHRRLLPLYPFTPVSVETMTDETALLVLALFKKLEQIIVLLNDNILKHIPALDLENTRSMSRFDNVAYAEKVGIVKSATRFIQAINLRNQLAHEYPIDHDKQTRLINAAIVESELMLETVDALSVFVTSRKAVWSHS